ncbi:MAG: beta-ketoacyl synthase N-terminal-like domain-containing protein [Thermoguttaceae bacterium]
MTEPVRANSIAIIGMAARLPGAGSVERFWSNVAGGVESITRFSDEQLLQAGATRELIAREDFVKAAPTLDDIEHFDAGFFKISRREAEIMDPQQRILLELAWETMERAGYAGGYRGLVGVFAGAGGLMSSYLCSPMHVNSRLIGQTGSMQCIGNDKDYLSTRISYKLDLRGPSLTVQTACSTSLVAVHLACQSLLSGECDMALAGGVTIRVPHQMGYLHSSQALLSPDGHCRPFDADAKGTIFGSGAGLVLLKPLPQALADGDHIHAVIRGSAVNNDGAAKLSYWATNAEGQMAACIDAMAVAETPPRSIGYLEAHGTATAMGDPVEIFGLTRAYRRGTPDKQFCAIGSVKSNFGHLEAAAGIAGLIKAALALEHKTLPPSLHYHQPNPAIRFPETPFFVNTECRAWSSDGSPRRAAVNSLGIGGTNAHIILEEAPETAAVGHDAEEVCLLTLSAKSAKALRELAQRYADYFGTNAAPLADVCFTANTGRGLFPHRLAVVTTSAAAARDALAAFAADVPDTEPKSRERTAPGEVVRDGCLLVHGVVESADGNLTSPTDEPDRQAMLAGLARLYVRGAKIDFAALDSDVPRRRVILPTYPFQRQRYWIDAMTTVIKQEVRGEIRLFQIDPAQLVESSVIDQCCQEISAALDRSEESQVIVDFSRVSFMSSMALGMLIRVNKRCKEYRVALKLSGISTDILQVFKITGMDKIFEIHANVDEAVAAFNAKGGFFRRTKPKTYEVK